MLQAFFGIFQKNGRPKTPGTNQTLKMFVISANQETGLAEPLSDWWRGEKGFPSSWAGGQSQHQPSISGQGPAPGPLVHF